MSLKIYNILNTVFTILFCHFVYMIVYILYTYKLKGNGTL